MVTDGFSGNIALKLPKEWPVYLPHCCAAVLKRPYQPSLVTCWRAER